MNRNKLFVAVLAGGLLAACESGDVNITPTTIDNSIDNSTGGGGGSEDDICASYVRDGATIQGSADGNGNCMYDNTFVGPKNNLQEDLLIPALPDGGAHIFSASLFVGNTYRTQADLQAAGISQGGDGPTLTIQAGATLAFQTNSDFMIINRGSRIIADGRPDAPITLTSVSDVNGTVGPEDVQQWGGVVINGFAVSNKCSYVGTRGEAGFDLSPGTECSIDAEGSAGDDESQYGGANDADDSGILRYVVVKHTGAQVGNGDELNGISFGGVGSSTIVENLEVYSTFDDGVEMFGGSFDIRNLVAVYVRDDSIDIDEGYNGTITDALVVQSANDGNHCIESDGIGSYGDLDQATRDDFIARGLNSAPTINNLTCIISANVPGTHDPGAGWRFREGIHPVVNDALIISSFGANDQGSADDNYCLRVDNVETHEAAINGDLQLNSVIYACQENVKGNVIADRNAVTAWNNEQEFAEAEGNQFATVADGAAVDASDAANPEINLLTGAQKVYSLPWDQSIVDTGAPLGTTTPTSGTATDILGAIEAQSDWTQPWAYGIDPDNRGQALWFE